MGYDSFNSESELGLKLMNDVEKIRYEEVKIIKCLRRFRGCNDRELSQSQKLSKCLV